MILRYSLPMSLAVSLCFFAGCGSSGEKATDPGTASSAPAQVPLTEAEAARAASLFQENGCVDCHGDDRLGGEDAPSLMGIRAHWTEKKLAKYIYNPEFYMVSNPAILKRNPGYDQAMPPFTHLSLEDRMILARWVLQESE